MCDISLLHCKTKDNVNKQKYKTDLQSSEFNSPANISKTSRLKNLLLIYICIHYDHAIYLSFDRLKRLDVLLFFLYHRESALVGYKYQDSGLISQVVKINAEGNGPVTKDIEHETRMSQKLITFQVFIKSYLYSYDLVTVFNSSTGEFPFFKCTHSSLGLLSD